MKKICNFCNTEITKKYRVLRNEKSMIYQCSYCEKKYKKKEGLFGYEYFYNSDVRKENNETN